MALRGGTFPRQRGKNVGDAREKCTVSGRSMGNLFGLASMLGEGWQGIGSGVDRGERIAKSPCSGRETDMTVIPR